MTQDDTGSAPMLGSVANHSAIPNSWIPVTERLPKPGQQVLAAIAGRFCNEENPALIETLDYEQKGFYSWKDDEWPKGVTHWMPLPAPPETSK